MNNTINSSNTAAQNSASAVSSMKKAEQSMNSAKESADKAIAASNNASSSAASAANSESNAIDAKNKATQSASEAKSSELNAKASEKSAADSAASLSYATQEETNFGIETRKIVSPKTLGTLLNLLQRNTYYKIGDIVYSSKLPSWAYLECTQAGTTGNTEPNLSMQEITDGSAKFRVVDKRLKAMIDILYPIGIVVTTATDDALKPGEADGLAQWEEIAQNRVLQGTSSGAGGTIEAGLPNIKGNIMTGDGNSGVTSVFGSGGKHSGALYVDEDKNFSNDAYAAPAGTGNNAFGFSFDASKSNNIYGNSSTVQPPAYKVHFWKRIK